MSGALRALPGEMPSCPLAGVSPAIFCPRSALYQPKPFVRGPSFVPPRTRCHLPRFFRSVTACRDAILHANLTLNSLFKRFPRYTEPFWGDAISPPFLLLWKMLKADPPNKFQLPPSPFTISPFTSSPLTTSPKKVYKNPEFVYFAGLSIADVCISIVNNQT